MPILNMLKTMLCDTDFAHYEGGHLYKRSVKQLDGLGIEVVGNGSLQKRKPQSNVATDATSTQVTEPSDDTSTAKEQPTRKQCNKRKRKKDSFSIARVKAFILTIDGNYDVDDYFVTLDFNDKSLENFKKRLVEFEKKLISYAKELGYTTKDLKYTIVIEFSPKNTKRKHAHVVISNLKGMCADGIIEMWEGKRNEKGTKAKVEVMTAEGIAEKERELKNGGCDITLLTRVQGSLAVYLAKGFGNKRHYFGERRVRHSNSVIKAKSASEALDNNLLNDILKVNREKGEYAAKCVLARAIAQNPFYRKYRIIDFYIYDAELDPYFGQRPEDKFKTSYVDYILCRYDDDNSTMEIWQQYAPLVGELVDDDADEIHYGLM